MNQNEAKTLQKVPFCFYAYLMTNGSVTRNQKNGWNQNWSRGFSNEINDEDFKSSLLRNTSLFLAF